MKRCAAKIYQALPPCLIPTALVFGVGFMALRWLSDKATDRFCGNTISQTIYSPDKKIKAVVFERDCGAITGYSTQVTLLAASDDLPNETGNIFIKNTQDGSLWIEWQKKRRLIIHRAPTVFKSKKRFSVATGWFQHESVAIDYAH